LLTTDRQTNINCLIGNASVWLIMRLIDFAVFGNFGYR
jgi:hypothetical protein